MRKIKLFLCLVAVAVSSMAFAQNIAVKGSVADRSTGEPVAFASVQVKGTMIGTSTDANGQYTITAPSNGTLVFSFVGYKTAEVAINGRIVVNADLEFDTQQLEEVVFVAYGTVSKKDFTGSAVALESKKLENRPLTNVTNALEGISAGVQFTSASGQPGSSGGIRIRGFGSINASNSPLYVVDGVPYDAISNINSDDIENITILKDAASSALYGSRAANGVVLVTTKKGRSEKITFNVKVNQGVSVRGIQEYDRLDAYQYVPMEWEGLRNSYLSASGSTYTRETANAAASANIMTQLGNNPFNVADGQVVGTDGKLNSSAKLLYTDDLDWSKAIARTGYKQEYSVNAGGATDKADYYMSLSYLNEEGYSIKSYMERANARLNINVTPKKWLKAGINLSGTMANSNIANDDSSTGYVNPFFFSRTIGPIYPIYQHDESGNYLLDANGEKQYEWTNRGGSAHPGRHVIAETLWNDNLYKRNILNTRAYVDITFFKGLKLSVNGGYDFRNYLNSGYDNPRVGDGSPAGRSRITNYRYDTFNFNQLLTYTNSINNHNFDFLVGHESYKNDYKYVYGMKQGIVAEGNTELVNFTTINSLTSYTNQYRTEGYIARANYNYSHKYYLSASFRRDATSRFYKDARWGNFWSVGGSWRIDQEAFLAGTQWLSALKLRASYGSVGNDGTDSWYSWQSLYGILNNANESGFIQSTQAGNTELKWEKNMSFDVALEFGVFNNRITGQFEFFHRISDNLLFQVPLPSSSGVLSQWQNIGTMYNRGIEVQLSGDIIRKKDFNWNMTLNLSHLKNEITKLPQEEIISGTKKYMVGHSMYDFWLRDWAGVDSETGNSLYYKDILDEEGNVTSKETTDDYTKASYYYVGTSIPKVYGSLLNTLTYKGFDLSFLLTYQLGGLVYDSSYGSLMSYSGYGSALHVDILNRWQNPGDITTVPRVDVGRNAYQNTGSSRWLTNASYLAIKNISLAYNLPKRWVEKIDLAGIRIYASGENIHSFTARKGMDPQYSFAGTQSNVYSPARIYTFGLNVQF
ncbi:MAG: TonB-dependent receptor [Bacteroidales bacterium]|nr:TonB-dependent receptor [Bacteroidales bacterium]MDD3201888.1 TonB-dependent receptor [Bacteroidales bacterium]